MCRYSALLVRVVPRVLAVVLVGALLRLVFPVLLFQVSVLVVLGFLACRLVEVEALQSV